ncbi:hypothetical protein RJ640_029940 [Escallonia rubra]|uniref:Tetratricopeptide repeat protein 27 homolog n=1 Tax=Escallonia rubra TaxID=112253 RepID=A0AA88UBK5_9ASTE|nr:hypothetical protein RJ640_029940 [Escallonia rubra]
MLIQYAHTSSARLSTPGLAQLDQHLLRNLELRLLRCSISPDCTPPSSDSHPPTDLRTVTLIQGALEAIESGHYARVLSSDASRLIFKLDSSEALLRNSTHCADRFYSKLVVECVNSFLVCDDIQETSYRAFLVMTVAVAALLAFTQCNMTGPLETLPSMPLMTLLALPAEGSASDWVEWEVWARNELMSCGSHLLGKLSNLQYIVFAKIMLMRIKDLLSEGSVSSMDGLRSISWWLARLLLLQQKMLDEHSSSLFDLLQVFTRESLHHFGTLEQLTSYWGVELQEEEALTILSMLHLEVGIMEHTYGRVNSSSVPATPYFPGIVRHSSGLAIIRLGCAYGALCGLMEKAKSENEIDDRMMVLSMFDYDPDCGDSYELTGNIRGLCVGICEGRGNGRGGRGRGDSCGLGGWEMEARDGGGGRGGGDSCGLGVWEMEARLHFESAEVALGLHLSVSGALGFRTVHQVEPKAQLLLLCGKSITNENGSCPPTSFEAKSDGSTVGEDAFLQHRREIREASDVLMTPKFLEDSSNCESSKQKDGGAARLTAAQQAVILAQCVLIEKSTPQDEMQRWEMTPYIEAIDSQQSSYFIIRFFCDILRIRWETTRTRTKERALMMMDKLVRSMQWEYGDLLVSCGLIGEAVKVYEDLDLWDNVIHCYCLLEKRAVAVKLIKTRLSERPSDPGLWCSLGDITNDDACYNKALEVSGNRSARAKRSLARNAYNRGEYEMSKNLWECAMALNSLYPDGWFALGAAALKARDVEKALDGFTRAVQLDPENGEAWNNIACLHMVKKKSKEASIAFKEALKFKRNSWQLWENYSHVAADIGNFSLAMEALQKVLNLTDSKRVDAELIERMMQEVEKRALSSHPESALATSNYDCSDQIHVNSNIDWVGKSTSLDVELSRTRQTENLVEWLGKILQQESAPLYPGSVKFHGARYMSSPLCIITSDLVRLGASLSAHLITLSWDAWKATFVDVYLCLVMLSLATWSCNSSAWAGFMKHISFMESVPIEGHLLDRCSKVKQDCL